MGCTSAFFSSIYCSPCKSLREDNKSPHFLMIYILMSVVLRYEQTILRFVSLTPSYNDANQIFILSQNMVYHFLLSLNLIEDVSVTQPDPVVRMSVLALDSM